MSIGGAYWFTEVMLIQGQKGIKRWFGNGFKTQAQVEAEEKQMLERYNEELRVRQWGAQIEPRQEDEKATK